jgi:hypothetical protein
MKLNRLETHDRHQHFTKQDFDISRCCQNLIDQKPFGNHPFYIFAHSRTEDYSLKKRLIWQPRLTRPLPQTNSLLFKAYPKDDTLKICWIIPAREMWGQYKKGQVCENLMIDEFIHTFEHNRALLKKNEEDDYSDEKIDQIYKEISQQAKLKKSKGSLFLQFPKDLI